MSEDAINKRRLRRGISRHHIIMQGKRIVKSHNQTLYGTLKSRNHPEQPADRRPRPHLARVTGPGATRSSPLELAELAGLVAGDARDGGHAAARLGGQDPARDVASLARRKSAIRPWLRSGHMPTIFRAIADWNPLSAATAAAQHLWANPNPSASIHAWPMQHPVDAALLWSIALLAIFAPLAVRLYARRTTG